MFGRRRRAVQFTACACVRHHQLYITGIPLLWASKMYVWVILLIPRHWIISWQFLLEHFLFYNVQFSAIWGRNRGAGSQAARRTGCNWFCPWFVQENGLIWAWFNFPVRLFNPRLQIWIQSCQSHHVEAECFVSRTPGEFFWTAIMKINWFSRMTNDSKPRSRGHFERAPKVGAVPGFIVLLILISQACIGGHLTQIYTDLLFIPRKNGR